MKIFILASGDATRWGGTVKQLQQVRGTTVLQRQIDMVKKYGYRYTVLSHQPKIRSMCINQWVVPENHDTLLNTVKSSANLWKTHTEVIFLLGDVIFTKKCFQTCVKQNINKSFQFYGSFDEQFCFRFTEMMYDKVIESIDNILAQSAIGSAWELYRSLVGIPIDKTWTDQWFRTLIQDKTDDIDYPEDYNKKIKSGYFDGAEFNL